MHYSYDTLVGKITIFADKNNITTICFAEVDGGEETSLIKEAHQQLEEYFAGKRRKFDLPLAIKGTDFQQKIWQNLLDIEYGKTLSYKELATSCGNAKACRAAGMACNKNPIAIIIPCHRVLGAQGKLTGYAGGLPAKQKLLELESAFELAAFVNNNTQPLIF